VTIYVGRGGNAENTHGRKCLCNALLANVGHPQMRVGNRIEKGLVTSGDDLATLAPFFPPEGGCAYGASDVVSRLLSEEI
jgi:nitronate monooxygenase